MKAPILACLLVAFVGFGATVLVWEPRGTNMEVLVEKTYPDPTNHFDWMPKLFPDDYNEPEWNRIRFGNNPVDWLAFRRGIFGNYWNGWEPVAATNKNAVILQSAFEPVVIKTNSVWLITFKR